MISLSDTDVRKAVRLLEAFGRTCGETLKESEDRRQARLLAKKLRGKTNGVSRSFGVEGNKSLRAEKKMP